MLLLLFIFVALASSAFVERGLVASDGFKVPCFFSSLFFGKNHKKFAGRN